MSSHRRLSAFSALIAVLAVVACAPEVAAFVTFQVNSSEDKPNDLSVPGACHTAPDGKCTLRAAVMQANLTNDTVIIQLPAGHYVLTTSPSGSNDASSGDLNLVQPENQVVQIRGAGEATTIIDGNFTDRVFNVAANRALLLFDLTIQNGFLTSGDGAGIKSYGEVDLFNVTIYNNKAASGLGGAILAGTGSFVALSNSTIKQNRAIGGGGIANDFGELRVNDSTIEHNIADLDGGGIYAAGASNITLVNRSTLYANTALRDGGAIWNGSLLTLVNSTLSQNGAANDGGGIYNREAQVNAYSTTIFGNGADSDVDFFGRGGGIVNSSNAGSVFNIRNVLVAGNYVSESPTYDDCVGTIGVYGSNFYGTVTASCNAVVGANSLWTTLNSLGYIGPLQNNGGPTQTHALLPLSNAIGGAFIFGCIKPDATPLVVDQRGFRRLVGAYCDVGAYEYNPDNIDIDGNKAYDALTDGLLILRYLFGLTDNPLIAGAIGTNATRTTPTAIKQYLDNIRASLDVDFDDHVDPWTDGLLVIRYLFGLRGTSLTAGALGASAQRNAPQIEDYVKSLMP